MHKPAAGTPRIGIGVGDQPGQIVATAKIVGVDGPARIDVQWSSPPHTEPDDDCPGLQRERHRELTDIDAHPSRPLPHRADVESDRLLA